MKTSKFYLLQPKNSIFGKLKEYNTDLYDLLTSKQIWQDVNEDHRNWSSADYIAKLKLSFLLATHNDYSKEEYFPIFFPEFSFTLSYFDRHWDITEIEIFENSEDRIQETLSADIPIEPFENDKVKDWLLSLKKLRN